MPVESQYKLRGFDHSNPGEIELFNLMGYHPTTLKARGCWVPKFNYSDKAIDLESRKNTFEQTSHKLGRKPDDVAFAVADCDDKIVGWIWFYHDFCHPLPSKVVTELGLTPRNCRIYQLSYEKLMSTGWPKGLIKKTQYVTLRHLTKRRKGVIVEGLKMAISRLARMYRKLYVYKRKLVLYAFVHRTNLASNIVLERNGFTRQKKKYSYDGTLHNLWVKVV